MENTYANGNIQLFKCGIGECSFFEMVDKLAPDNTPLHRFLTLMRKIGVECCVEEELEVSNELQYEKYSAEVRTSGAVTIQSKRITFFCAYPSDDNWHNTCLNSDTVVGYAIIIKLVLPNTEKRYYLHEAISKPPCIKNAVNSQTVLTPVTNYYFHTVKEFNTPSSITKCNT